MIELEPEILDEADAGVERSPVGGAAPEDGDGKARATTGTVDIFCEPWANVYLGSRKVGVAPQRKIRLPIGRHKLRLSNPVLGVSKTITVTVPSERPIKVTLPPAAGPGE